MSNIYRIFPKKSLGQYFLNDLSVAQRIVETTSFYPELPVLEVGPGTGVLTQFLLYSKRNLTVVEIDERSVNFLKKRYPQLGNRIIEADFLKLSLGDLFPGYFYVIGNYPYSIASQIFFKILDYKDKILSCSGMLQKEVAERLVSSPGKKTYGIITVLLRTWYDVEYLFTVPPSCFNPNPKVDSAVVRMVRNGRTNLGCDESLFRTIVKTAFNQRRKILRNSLKSLFRRETSISISPLFYKRPEQLSIEEFIELANLFNSLKS
ncbi:16S rRNA (adenine(1518)-N(6)/adenine(1519)-N(6))-dimethyltransferase RsmA [Candidatus Azobacteroides pseudotrichonymphae]|jgi:16S rRNA (adenine1518-N6/adenine1519-N6)-dimethyltransferase|uniref:Ribosomal RNA small subunit methyltransferase A n=1 Tax=Azobacteroides pseudotrichonymphae genomovar. CFP2 TaxID=511995 RepID=B6YRC8_AZOPC|nr:dimethyladenosine transferase [Candidatus Azobacteroides pseudotrichonymphae genomovar. CFP2]